jgi:gamma-glutamyltranspeptidase/glutathione hydrolase
MAAALSGIARHGPDYFYGGEIARRIVRCSESLGGLFTSEDFAAHRSDWVDPIHASYRGYEIFELPPASQGFVALEMLKLLEAFELKALNAGGAEALHLMIEAKKIAFRDRDAELADRDHMKVSIAELLSPARLDELRSDIRGKPAEDSSHAGAAGADTEYIAAADREGNLVSFIQSNFMGFGSGVVEPDTGIILHNRAHLFSLDPAHPNCIGPRKRCVHTLSPGLIVKDGRPHAALGLKGGHVQPQVQTQIICNLLDHGMTPQQAIAAPRFNHIEGAKVSLEAGFDDDVRQELSRRGHQLVAGTPESFGGAHMILIHPDSGAFVGASDPRKGGCALGF